MRLMSLLIGAIVLIGLISGCGNNDNDTNANGNTSGGKGNSSDVVATYDGGEITLGQYERYKSIMKVLFGDMYTQLSMMDPNFDETILSQQIGIEILAERATDDQLKEAKTQAEEDWKKYRKEQEEAGVADGLDRALETEGLKESDLIDFVEKEMASMFYYRDKVDDEEAQAHHEQLLEENEHAFDQATVRHILIQTYDLQNDEEVLPEEEGLARAEEVRQKLIDGESFDELAEEYSDDEGSVSTGGLMEDVNVNMWVENFKKAAIELPIDEISEPIKTEYGYHVMKVESRRTVDFDELKQDIKMSIAQEEYQRFLTEELPELVDEKSFKLPKAATE